MNSHFHDDTKDNLRYHVDAAELDRESASTPRASFGTNASGCSSRVTDHSETIHVRTGRYTSDLSSKPGGGDLCFVRRTEA
jgi:hypothetical protein